MKIAYCFAGHARTWERCLASFFEHIYKVAPGDIFIHTWNNLGTQTPAYWNGFEGISEQATREQVDAFALSACYGAKAVLVEQERSIVPIPRFKEFSSNTWAHTCKTYYESRRKAFLLAEAHGPYDRIFSLRLDFKFLSSMKPEDLQNPNLLVAKHRGLIEMGAHTDAWAIGSQEQIDKLTQYYFHIDEYWFNKDKHPHHELAWHEYLLDLGIIPEASSIRFSIPRLAGPDTCFPE